MERPTNHAMNRSRGVVVIENGRSIAATRLSRTLCDNIEGSPVPSDNDIARRSLGMQRRASDVPLIRIPAYTDWSEKKLAHGFSPALIANLDARSMWLLPEDVATVTTDIFDELLDDLNAEIGDDE